MPPKTPNPNALTLKEAIAYAGALLALGAAWADLRSEIRQAQILRVEDQKTIEEMKGEIKTLRQYVFEIRGVQP